MFYIALESKIKSYINIKVARFYGQPFLFLFLIFIFSACTFFSKDKVICKVGDAKLYSTELQQRIALFYPNLKHDIARDKAIKNWVQQQQIRLQTLKVDPKEQKENILKNEDALSKLNLFILENDYIKKHIDSNISASEILGFYSLHRNNYKTSSFIVKALYVKVPDSLVSKLNIQNLFLLNNEADINKLEKFANHYPITLYYEPNRWIYLDDLTREIPISNSQKETLVKSKKQAIFDLNGKTHYINILNYNTKTVSSPMEFEKANIRNHILKQRAYKLREKAKKIILKNLNEKFPVTYY